MEEHKQRMRYAELELPSLETRREQSSLTFFYKIHSGTVYIDKDTYFTPALGLKQARGLSPTTHNIAGGVEFLV